ncbi:hypothetical protein GQ457_02G018230 [Hibiscus cannabinus]
MPQVVSFGPYHQGKDHLMPMEDHMKQEIQQTFRSFCSRSVHAGWRVHQQTYTQVLLPPTRPSQPWGLACTSIGRVCFRTYRNDVINQALHTTKMMTIIIRSAKELNEARIRFKKSKSVSLKDIEFRGGILRLPVIIVDDATESMFLNLIAFERFHIGAGNEVTSYIFFMDNIVDNVLHSRGIIQNALGSDKAVANLFNSLLKDITLEPDSSHGLSP